MDRGRHEQLRAVAMLRHHRQHLLDEERIALGGRGDPGPSLVVQLDAAELDQLVALPMRERLQDDGADIRAAADQAGPLVHHLRSAETKEQDRGAGRPLRDVLDEVEERGLGPVDVLDHHNKWSLMRKRLEQLPRRPERLFVRARLTVEANRAENALGDRIGLFVLPERLPEVADVLDDPSERPEGDPFAVGRAVTLEDGRLATRRQDQFAPESRLADPCGAEHREELSGSAFSGAFVGLSKLSELHDSADQRRLQPAGIAGRFGLQLE